jgi:hypothetical protein
MLYNIHHEMRLAFQSCSKPSVSKVRYRTFKTFPHLPAPARGTSINIKRSSPTEDAKDVATPPGTVEPSPLKSGHQEASRSNTTELVPRTPKPGALQRPRRSDLPARLLPKAHVSPELILSPKERLQIEYETRRPPKAGEKPGEHGKMYNGQTSGLTSCSLQRAPVDLSWWSRIHQLYSATTSHNHVCCWIWSCDHGSSIPFV